MVSSIHDVIDWRFLQLPVPAVAVVAGEREAVPVGVVELRAVGAVLVAGPARFGAVERVARHSLGGQHPEA